MKINFTVINPVYGSRKLMKKLVFFSLVIICSCKNSNDKKVENAMRHYDDLILRADAQGIAEMYMPDGEMVLPGRAPIRGRDSIEQFFSAFKDMKAERQKRTTDSIRRFGDTVKKIVQC